MVTVSVAVSAVLPVIPTGEVAPKLKVGMSCAPDGLEVIAAVRVTLPVNPPVGVTVMVEVLPVVAPGSTVTDEPMTVKLTFATVAVTVKFTADDVEPAYVLSPL